MLFEDIHYHHKAPLNNNIRLIKDQPKIVKVFMDGRWKIFDRNAACDIAIRGLCRVVQKIMDSMEADNNLPSSIRDYFASILRKETTYYELRRMIIATMYDHTTEELTLIPQNSAGVLA